MTTDPEFDAWLQEQNAKGQAEIEKNLDVEKALEEVKRRAEENERKGK